MIVTSAVAVPQPWSLVTVTVALNVPYSAGAPNIVAPDGVSLKFTFSGSPVTLSIVPLE